MNNARLVAGIAIRALELMNRIILDGIGEKAVVERERAYILVECCVIMAEGLKESLWCFPLKMELRFERDSL